MSEVDLDGKEIIEYPKWVRKDGKEVIVKNKAEEDAFFGKTTSKPASGSWGKKD